MIHEVGNDNTYWYTVCSARLVTRTADCYLDKHKIWRREEYTDEFIQVNPILVSQYLPWFEEVLQPASRHEYFPEVILI